MRILKTVVAASLIWGVACGTDEPSASSAEYCDAVTEVVNYDDGLHGEGDPDVIKAAYVKVLKDLDEPLRRIAEGAPDESKELAADLRSAFTKSRDEGVDPFDNHVGTTSKLIEASAPGCGWSVATAAASDYAFPELPKLKPGTTVLRLTNASQAEPHLFMLLRVNDGVTKSVDELLAQFDDSFDPAKFDFEMIDGGAFAPPAAETVGLFDNLKPGRYVYLCPIPVQGGTGEQDDHAKRGMKGELVVA